MYYFYKQKLCTHSRYIAKFLMVMRLTTLILLSFMMQVSAASFAQRVTLSERNASLLAVFDKISDQTGFDFIVTSDLLKQAKLVNIKVVNQTMPAVLDQIFKEQPLNFSIKNRIVVVSAKEKSISDRLLDLFSSYTLTGTVLNEYGQPLAGANVMILYKNTGYGTADDGKFILDDMDGREILITTYTGYKTDTLQLRGERSVTIRMQPLTVGLSEVNIINTGYQRLSKERATGSYGKPDMQTFNTRVFSTDVVSRLEGLVAGVTVTPGPRGIIANRFGTGSNQQSVVRGISTVGLLTDPLYVVDGVQVPNLSFVNPNDIADITVLKDAAASAIYGAKAANGVIVVVTKSGRKDQGVQISYNGAISFSGKPRLNEKFFMNSAQLIQTARELFDPIAYPASQLSYGYTTPHEAILYKLDQKLITAAQAEKSLDSLSKINNRSQINDLFYRNAFTTNNTVSASGGTKSYSLYSSLSHIQNHSATPGEANNTYQIGLNQSINPAHWLTIGLNSGLNNNISKSKSPITVGAGFLPYQLFADNNGNPLLMNYMTGWSAERQADYQLRSRINLDYYPLDEINKGDARSNLLNVSNTATIAVRFWKGLSFQGTYGYQRSTGTTEAYKDNGSMDMRKELLNFTVARSASTAPVYYLPNIGGKFTSRDRTGQNWTLRNQLVFSTGLRDGRDRLNIQIGQEAQEQSTILNTSIRRGYDRVLKTYTLLDYATLSRPLFGAIGSGYSIFSEKPFDRIAEKSRFSSYFGLFNYSLNDRYLFDASIRTDKSSLFASDESAQNKPAYSVGMKWQMSKEQWFRDIGWINNLGLRTTYGVAGNSPYVGAASTYDILYAGQDNVLGKYLHVNSPANNKLSWEATHTWNFGLDFGVLNNRLNGSMDLYFKNTTGLIGEVEYNPFTGTEATTGNIGNIKNSGVELSLSSTNLMTSRFSWTTGMVFSYNANKLEKYSKPSQFLMTASSQIYSSYKVGFPRQSIFAYQYAGLDELGDPQIRKADGSITKNPQAAVQEDLVYMGTTQPKFNGGLNNTFRYKTFSLSASVIYNLGAVLRKPIPQTFSGRLSVNSFSDGNLIASFSERWKRPGDEQYTNIPSYVADQGINYSRRNTEYYTFADVNVISSSYIKLRDITLSHDFSSALIRKMKVQKISLFMQTGNFMIWKANDDGIDPEYLGEQRGNHMVSLGLNVSF